MRKIKLKIDNQLLQQLVLFLGVLSVFLFFLISLWNSVSGDLYSTWGLLVPIVIAIFMKSEIKHLKVPGVIDAGFKALPQVENTKSHKVENENISESNVVQEAEKQNVEKITDDKKPDFQLSTFSELDAAIKKEDNEKIDELVEQIALSYNFSEQKKLSFKFEWMYFNGVDKAFDDLKKLEDEKKDWFSPSYSITIIYKQLGREDLALKHNQIGFERCDDEKEKVRFIIQKSEIIGKKKENLQNAIACVKSFKEQISNTDNIMELDSVMIDLYKKHGAKDEEINALEKFIYNNPEDKNKRFRIAYLYADREQNLLSLYHYNILINQDSSYQPALNNLGVLFDKFGLPIKTVSAWNNAKDQGDAHAAGNLANRLIDAGFINKAKHLIDDLAEEALGDERVKYAKNRLNSIEKEEKKLEPLQEKAENLHSFIIKKMKTETKQTYHSLKHYLGKWKNESGTLTIEKKYSNEDSFHANYTTSTQKFKLNGEFKKDCIMLKGEQTHYRVSGLASLKIGSQQWTESRLASGLFDATNLTLELTIKDNKTLEGIKNLDPSFASMSNSESFTSITFQKQSEELNE